MTGKHAASTLVFGKEVTLHTYGLDKYGRTIADVLLPDGTNVNHTLVKDGGAIGETVDTHTTMVKLSIGALQRALAF